MAVDRIGKNAISIIEEEDDQEEKRSNYTQLYSSAYLCSVSRV